MKMKRHHERDARKIAVLLNAVRPHPDLSGQGVPDFCRAVLDVGSALYSCDSTASYYLALGILEARDDARDKTTDERSEESAATRTLLRLATVDGKPVEPTL
jgi:hypothetical protein